MLSRLVFSRTIVREFVYYVQEIHFLMEFEQYITYDDDRIVTRSRNNINLTYGINLIYYINLTYGNNLTYDINLCIYVHL